MKNRKNIVVIGCGRLGATIANGLYERGEDVIVIDKSQNSFKRLSSSFGGLTICMDAANLEDLKDANISKCDIAIVVTNKDTTNIMISEILKEEFQIKKIIARLTDPDRRFVYDSLGIEFISPAILFFNRMEDILYKEGEI